jgi:predicted nucleotidyltransferase
MNIFYNLSNLHHSVRLNTSEINAIKKTMQTLDPNAKIYLFGSRTDMNKKGGDIDLLILSQILNYNDKLRLKIKLFALIEEQKIDLVIAKDTTEPFVQLALEQGILL